MTERVTVDAFGSVPAPPGGTTRRVRLDDFPWYESAAVLLSEPDPGPTPFLVANLIVDQAVAAIQGPPKVGKTWLVLELAVAIASGRDALGHAAPERGPVLLVLEESGRAALHRRLGALARGRAIDPTDLAGFHFAANRRVQLDDPDWRARLLAAGRELQPRAIFLDPLARVKGASVDENVQKEIGPVLDFMRQLRDATGSAVIFVHHTPHELGRLRGSSDIEATWESKLAVSRDESGVCSVTAEHREAESGGTLRYRLNWDEPTKSVRLEPEQADAEIVERMTEALASGEPMPTEDLAKAVGKRRNTVEQIAESDSRFVQVPPPLRVKHNAKCWTLSEVARPGPGTSRDEQNPGPLASARPETPKPPVGGWVPDGQAQSSSACPSELADEFPLLGDPDFPSFLRGRYRSGHLTREEWLARLRLHPLVALEAQGTIDAVLDAEVEQLAGEGVVEVLEGEEAARYQAVAADMEHGEARIVEAVE